MSRIMRKIEARLESHLDSVEAKEDDVKEQIANKLAEKGSVDLPRVGNLEYNDLKISEDDIKNMLEDGKPAVVGRYEDDSGSFFNIKVIVADSVNPNDE